MGRFSGSTSYGHRIREMGGYYRLSWATDRYYAGSRLRHPRTTERDTDEKGAERFAKKWGISTPTKNAPTVL